MNSKSKKFKTNRIFCQYLNVIIMEIYNTADKVSKKFLFFHLDLLDSEKTSTDWPEIIAYLFNF